MSEVIVKSRQTIFDVTIQELGTLENLRDVVLSNELNFNDFLEQGTILNVDSEGKGNEDVKYFYVLNGIIPQNNWLKEDFLLLTCDNNLITCDNNLITCDQNTL